MKNKNKLSFQFFSFLICAVISAAFTVAFKYYITFSEEAAGSYQIITIFGDPLKIFLIKILSVAASLLALITFIIKSIWNRKNKILFPIFLTLFGLIWIILPVLSAYTISRFTGLLIVQTVSSIAIISNAVFFMISMCFAGISLVDVIQSIIIMPDKKGIANCFASAICGIPFGISLAIFLSSVLETYLGSSSIFIFWGIVAFFIGLISKRCITLNIISEPDTTT